MMTKEEYTKIVNSMTPEERVKILFNFEDMYQITAHKKANNFIRRLRNYVKDVHKNYAVMSVEKCTIFVFSVETYKYVIPK